MIDLAGELRLRAEIAAEHAAQVEDNPNLRTDLERTAQALMDKVHDLEARELAQEREAREKREREQREARERERERQRARERHERQEHKRAQKAERQARKEAMERSRNAPANDREAWGQHYLDGYGEGRDSATRYGNAVDQTRLAEALEKSGLGVHNGNPRTAEMEQASILRRGVEGLKRDAVESRREKVVDGRKGPENGRGGAGAGDGVPKPPKPDGPTAQAQARRPEPVTVGAQAQTVQKSAPTKNGLEPGRYEAFRAEAQRARQIEGTLHHEAPTVHLKHPDTIGRQALAEAARLRTEAKKPPTQTIEQGQMAGQKAIPTTAQAQPKPTLKHPDHLAAQAQSAARKLVEAPTQAVKQIIPGHGR